MGELTREDAKGLRREMADELGDWLFTSWGWVTICGNEFKTASGTPPSPRPS